MHRAPLGMALVSAVLFAPACSRQPAPVAPPASKAPPAVTDGAAAAPNAGQPATGLAALRSQLKAATTDEARIAAVDALADLGQNAAPAIDDLVAATKDADPRVRWHAARALGMVGEDAVATIPLLIALLADEDPLVVAQSAAAIGMIRADEDVATITPSEDGHYKAAFAALSKTMVHADPRARRAAIRGLKSLNPAPDVLAPLFANQLSDSDPSVVVPALHTLADMDELAVPVLLEALKNPKSRYWATVGLAEVGEEAAAATLPLVRVLEEGEIHEQMQAILALAAIGEKGTAAGPAILKLLQSPDKSLRFPAAFAVGKMRIKEADEPLQAVARDADPFLAAVATWARAKLNPGDKALREDAIARLKAGLASDDALVRDGAADGLSDLAAAFDDEEKCRMADLFAGLIQDKDPKVAVSAGAALIRLGPAAVDALRGKLADPALRLTAMEILGELGPAAKPALGELVKALGDADPVFRSEAAAALSGLGPDAAPAIPELRRLLGDETVPAQARYPAAFALGSIGAEAKPALGELRTLAKSADELMATVAVWAALKIDPTDTELAAAAVPLLRRALRADREIVRLEAVVALGDIGPAAAAAVPILQLVSEDDPSRGVRQAAAAALAKIRR